MHIEIAQRLNPFCHLPGCYFMLPGTTLRLQIFPALIRVADLRDSIPKHMAEIPLPLTGPVEQFTVFQNLHKGLITVSGHTPLGYVRYHLISNLEKIGIFFEKTPRSFEFSSPFLNVLNTKPHLLDQVHEQLSLGSHKAQDWEMILRRQDFAEIFPLWFRLGQLTPEVSGAKNDLFSECQRSVSAKETTELLSKFRKIFLVGFDRFLSPRSKDEDFNGIASNTLNRSPLTYLSVGSQLIRSLFLQEEEATFHVLPALPPEFHSGRFLNAVSAGGMLDLEWSKKSVRRLIFRAKASGAVSFNFPKQVNGCRLRFSSKDKGIFYKSGHPIEIEFGKIYWFDNFKR